MQATFRSSQKFPHLSRLFVHYSLLHFLLTFSMRRRVRDEEKRAGRRGTEASIVEQELLHVSKLIFARHSPAWRLTSANNVAAYWYTQVEARAGTASTTTPPPEPFLLHQFKFISFPLRCHTGPFRSPASSVEQLEVEEVMESRAGL
ncbi:hypothetical protein TRVL_04726 [Trypanosoma vivax]|nr:hypothetical protein TRVL_04726 [Trypanosoma vivax]